MIIVDRSMRVWGTVAFDPLRPLESSVGLRDGIPLRPVEEEETPAIVKGPKDSAICECEGELRDDDGLEVEPPPFPADDFEPRVFFGELVRFINEDEDFARVLCPVLPRE